MKRRKVQISLKRLETVGDAAWRLAVTTRIAREELPRWVERHWNSNKTMAQFVELMSLPTGKASTLEKLGAVFEMHVGEIYLKHGMKPVDALCQRLCPAHPKTKSNAPLINPPCPDWYYD